MIDIDFIKEQILGHAKSRNIPQWNISHQVCIRTLADFPKFEIINSLIDLGIDFYVIESGIIIPDGTKEYFYVQLADKSQGWAGTTFSELVKIFYKRFDSPPPPTNEDCPTYWNF